MGWSRPYGGNHRAAVLGLGLPVLAEGVETSAELQFLQDELCDEVPGCLLGRPAGIGSFRDYTHGAAFEPNADFTPRSQSA